MKALDVVSHLEEVLGPQSPPRILLELIEKSLVSEFGLLAIAACEKAEILLDSVRKIIEQRASKAIDSGTTSVLIIAGTTNELVCGSCFVFSSDDESIAAAKRNRVFTSSLLGSIKSLSFSDFERFGRRVLYELGAGSAYVTPHGNDQGIDFYGSFSFGQIHGRPKPFFKLSHDVNLLFAGQAKHYPNTSIGPDVVRELIGSVALARTKTHSKDGVDIFQDLNIRPFSPVVAILFTTGGVTSGARRLSAAAGLVVKDGEQLAAFLADSGVGIDQGASPNFSHDSFMEWLKA